MRNTSTRGLVLCAAIVASSSGVAGGGWWFEDFSHNNPALYTNMNGQPDNLTITGGIARFTGAGGAYYARQDLLIQLSPEWTSILEGYRPSLNIAGTVGIGWFSPSLNQGISARHDFGTNTSALVRHDGWNSSVVLASVVVLPTNWLYLHVRDNGWSARGIEKYYGPPPVTEDMFFFMYGSEDTVGPGALDYVMDGLPEPSGLAVLAIGSAALLLLRRRGPRR